MRKNNGGIWIDYEFKKEYQDSSLKGLRLHFSKKLQQPLIDDIKIFINFLRKNYYFPIRCNLYFCKEKNFVSLDGTGKTKGIFYFGDENLKTFPSIYVACAITHNWKVENIYYSIVKLLTYYFQWYFYEDDKRNSRSLEIEATKYADFIVGSFLNLE